jgi:hypothetical protein
MHAIFGCGVVRYALTEVLFDRLLDLLRAADHARGGATQLHIHMHIHIHIHLYKYRY